MVFFDTMGRVRRHFGGHTLLDLESAQERRFSAWRRAHDCRVPSADNCCVSRVDSTTCNEQGTARRVLINDFCTQTLDRNLLLLSNKRAATLKSVMASALRFVPPMEDDLEPVRLLTIQETAQLMQISTKTLYRMAQSKEVPAVKVGRQWRFRENEIVKWIQGLGEL